MHRLAIGLLTAVMILGLHQPLRAAVITDGALTVNIESGGEFNVISLNGFAIDTSSFVQQYMGNTCAGFSAGSAVVTAGGSAVYTAQCGDFDVTVVSRILGPLPSAPATSNVLEQRLLFRNRTPDPLNLAIVSNMDQDLVDSAGDVVAFNWPRRMVYAVDTAQTPIRLMAALARTPDRPMQVEEVPVHQIRARFGWDVDVLGAQSVSFPMDNGAGPVGPGDTAMSLGFDFGIAPSGSATPVVFRYLFLLGDAGVPQDFAFSSGAAVPSLSPLGLLFGVLLLAGVGVIALRHQRIQ